MKNKISLIVLFAAIAFPFYAQYSPGIIAASQTLCIGSTLTPFTSSISASGGTGTITYQWESSTTSTNSGFTNISGANAAAYNPVTLSTTTYFRRGASTNVNPVIYSNVLTVAVTTLSPPVISGPTAVCTPTLAQLSSNSPGASSYSWTSSVPGPVVSTQTAGVVFFAPGAINFTCMITDEYSCSASGTYTVTGFAVPNLTVTGSTVCVGQAAIVTASGASTYLWSGPTGSISTGATASIVIMTNTSPQIFTVTGNSGPCSRTSTVALSVFDCTSVKENFNGDKIFMYPNPNNGIFTISGELDATLELFTAVGQNVKTIYLNAENGHNATVSDLAAGIYFIISSDKFSSIRRKLIIENSW